MKMKPKWKICDLCGKPVLYPCQCTEVKTGKVLFHKFFVRFPWIKNEYYHIDCGEIMKEKWKNEVKLNEVD